MASEGETWYVKIRDAQCLSTKKIIDMTLHTVELEDVNSLSSYRNSRYEISDIKFVEKVSTKE